MTTTTAQLRQVALLYRERAGLAYYGYVRRDPLEQLRTRSGRDNPYKIYDRLRVAGGLSRTRRGNWVSPSHALCSKVLRDRRFGAAPADAPPPGEEFNLSFLEMNPPDHTRLRRLVTPAFSPKNMESYRARIKTTVNQLLDDVDGPFDLVTDFAAPLPIKVISDLVGVPPDRAADFARYGATIGSALDGVRSPAHAREFKIATDALTELFTVLFELRRREPADDVLSAIVAAEGDDVQPIEMVPLCMLLIIAGFETTVNLIGNAALALFDNPAQWDMLRADPSLGAAVTEETLRFDPPVQRTARFALEDVELDGRLIKKDELVVALIGGANRDPEVYDDPSQFDIMRDHPTDHLAFAAGIHYCIGQPLARLEGAIALGTLAERMPGLRRDGRLVRRASTGIRGPLHLPVRA